MRTTRFQQHYTSTIGEHNVYGPQNACTNHFKFLGFPGLVTTLTIILLYTQQDYVF